MAAPFAALQAQLAEEVLAHLANADAVLPGGGVVGVFVDDDPEGLLDGLTATPGLRITFPVGAPGLASGVQLTVGTHTVRLRRADPEQPNVWSAVRT